VSFFGGKGLDYSSIDFLQDLFELEREIREASNPSTLAKVITVRSQAVLGFKDAVFCAGSSAQKMRAQADSNSDLVDPSSPVLTWVEELCAVHSSQLENGINFVASPDNDIKGKNLLPKHVLFVPLQSKNQGLLGCLVLTRTAKFSQNDILFINHLAGTIGHALAIFSRKPNPILDIGMARLATFIVVTLFLLSVFPMHLTTLAPAEVVAYQPEIIKAPIDGVIDEITVTPNTQVGPGSLLARLNNHNLKAVYDDVAQKTLLAESRISNPQGKRVSEELRSDLEKSRARMESAEERLLQTDIRAETSGIAIVKAPGEWIGRPVKAGEKILEIANPREVELVLEIPAEDADLISQNSKVRIFLDRSPFSPLTANVIDNSLVPKKNKSNETYYTFRARFDEGVPTPPIGQRGVARVYGERSSLLFFIFREQMKFYRNTFRP
ncbi:MAG: HlyD family efflux transporter periplasmic adaptor subunit, partial [Pseudomonadota bacterium]|nr:HlyD family efflux transporter periplasmic adaptor subunit [Pseudomonadota bacterium]